MRDILDPADRWLGTPGAALAFGNKSPVALDDDLTVFKDSGPVTVNVLANDSDPEGAALTLISATAALGTAQAEADNTVTYTPPAGLSGFDTVVYEIADDLDQRRTAQINVSIIELQITIDTQPDNTLVITSETGLVDITVTNPIEFAGTYQIDASDLTGGPINLAVPSFSGDATQGQVLTASAGLWVYDTSAGTPSQSWQWTRAGIDIAGATGTSYTVTAGDVGQALSLTETLTDAFGQRSATSAQVTATSSAFTPSDDVALIGWWDASDAATLTETGGELSGWTDKAGGLDLVQSSPVRQPATGSRLLNGLNVIDFSGSHFMERPDTLPLSGNVAFHVAMEIDGATNAFEAVLALEATNDFQLDANNAAQFDGRLNLAGVGSAINLTGGPYSGALILSVVFDFSGGTAEVFIGDTSRGATPYTAALDSNTVLHLMTNRSRNAFANGCVAEVIVTGDTTNRAAHHDYLSAKWGIS